MVLMTCKVLDSDQIWDAWVWNIREHLISTINGWICSVYKRSSPYCFESLLMSNFLVLRVLVCPANEPKPIADS